MATAYIALGANLGNRLSHLRSAAQAIAELGPITARSSVWETEAQGPPPDYLNAVLSLSFAGEPLALLDALLAIEAAHGRRRFAGEAPNLPRTLDLDVLLFDDRVIASERLVVPHPRMHARAFVLSPLVEIAPDLVHPLLHCSMSSLLAGLTGLAGGARVLRMAEGL